MAEYHLLTAMGRSNELTSEVEMQFPKNNLWLRDVDAIPVYIEEYSDLQIGACIEK